MTGGTGRRLAGIAPAHTVQGRGRPRSPAFLEENGDPSFLVAQGHLQPFAEDVVHSALTLLPGSSPPPPRLSREKIPV